MKLSDILSKLGFAPKDLEQARTAMEPAKATLELVGTLFANAGLNLDQMLEAGPDALKAHLDAMNAADEKLAAALERCDELKAENEAVKAASVALGEAFESVGFKPTAGADVKAAFADHVKKAAALELAKAGHPPVKAVESSGASPTDRDLLVQWRAIQNADERLKFFQVNEAAIMRASGIQH